MTETTRNLEFLQEKVRQLNMLLADPHPGLHTWQDTLRRHLDSICDFHQPGAEGLLNEMANLKYLVSEIARIERSYGLRIEDPKGRSVWDDRLTKIKQAIGS